MGICGTLQWRHVDHVLLNWKKGKDERGFEPRFLRVMTRDGIHSATQYTNLLIVTSSEYNDQDLKDASKFNASLRCLPRRWLIWQEQTIGKLESSFFITYHFIYYLLIPVFIQLRMITWEMKLPWIAFYKFVLTTSCIDSWRGYDTVLPIVLCILLLCSVNRFYSYLFGREINLHICLHL